MLCTVVRLGQATKHFSFARGLVFPNLALLPTTFLFSESQIPLPRSLFYNMSLPSKSPARSDIKEYTSEKDDTGSLFSATESDISDIYEKSNLLPKTVVAHLKEPPKHRSITTFRRGDGYIYRYVDTEDPDSRRRHWKHHEKSLDKLYHFFPQLLPMRANGPTKHSHKRAKLRSTRSVNDTKIVKSNLRVLMARICRITNSRFECLLPTRFRTGV
jgi:hypothetical protein